MASSDIKVLASSTVAVQGRAVVTNAPDYLLTTTQLRVCTGVAIRGQEVAILLHADCTTTKDDIAAAVGKACKMDNGDLSVQYICHEDEKTKCMELMDQKCTEGAICVACYREKQGVIVCMDSRKSEIYMLFSGPLYKGLNEIKDWSILYNLLQYDKTPRQFGKLFLENIDDVNSAKDETVNALCELKPELVTEDDRVDSKELQNYIMDTRWDANLVTFLEKVEGQSNVRQLYGEATIGEGIVKWKEIKDYFEKYINLSLQYAKEINDIVTSPE